MHLHPPESIFLFQSAIGAVLGGAFVTLSADPLLEVNPSLTWI